MLSEDERIRYRRQIMYPGFGKSGQVKLKASHVLVAGVGGLGSAASMYLAYAGIGHITIVDNDSVELSNLNRQMLHWDRDIGKKKTTSATGKLRKINSGMKITALCKKAAEDNMDQIINGVDVVIDGLDNYQARFALNGACVRRKVPFIHAGVNGLVGQITTIVPDRTPCLACIYADPPLSEERVPVFGVTPSLIASLQVMEAIKLIAGFGETLEGRMLYFNGETMEFACENLVKNPKCGVCGTGGQNLKENRR